MLFKEVRIDPRTKIASGAEKFPDLLAYLVFVKENFKWDTDNLDLSTVEGLSIVDGKLIISDINKSAINRACAGVAPKVIDTNIADTVMESLKGLSLGDKTRRLQRLEESARNASRRVHEYNTELLNSMVALSAARLKIAELATGGEFNLVEAVRKILADGYWKIEGWEGRNKTLTFISVDDVWVNFNEVESQVNQSYNAGLWRLRLQLNNDEIRMSTVPATPGHFSKDGYPHPHVDSSGGVCLGNAGASYHDATNSLDLARMAEITKIILTTYNPGNPYISFEHYYNNFKRQQERNLRNLNEQAIRSTYQSAIINGRDFDGDDADVWFDEAVENF